MSIMTLPSTAPLAEITSRLRSRKSFHIRGTAIDRASFDMLRLYRTNLEVRLCCIDAVSLDSECQKHTYSTVSEMLKSARDGPHDRELEWNEMHKAERLMALLLSGAALRQEIRGRLQDYAAQKPADADRLRAEYDSMLKPDCSGKTAADDNNVARAFLLRLMELIHRTEKERYLARPIRKQATKNLLVLLIGAFLLMIAPYLFLTIDFAPSQALSRGWSQFALYTALMSGLFGALFSRLLSLQRNGPAMSLDEIFLHREVSYTLLRAGFGMCAAFIAYFLLRAGLLDSALFPKFDKLAIEFVAVPPPAAEMTFGMPSKDLALLIVWCFLAGFSEMLVPNLLGNTERHMADAGAPARGR